MRNILFLLAIALTLSACSSASTAIKNNGVIQDRDKEYLDAKNIPPLKIPPGTPAPLMHAHYPIPPKDYPPHELEVSLTPPGLTASSR